MAGERLPLHGRQHRKGGEDPVPFQAYEQIEDEGVDLTKRFILDFVGAGVTATDDGVSKTVVTIPGAGSFTYSAFAPVLTAVTVDPTLGTGDGLQGRYIKIGKLVHYYGQANFGGTGFNDGSGAWLISLPFIFAGLANGSPGFASLNCGDNSAAVVLQTFGYTADTFDDKFWMFYQASLPFGAIASFGGDSAFPFVAPPFANSMLWSIVYETSV